MGFMETAEKISSNILGGVSGVLLSVFGSRNERVLKRIYPIVDAINELEKTMKAMSDEQLKRQTEIFRHRFREGESLDQLLPEAFATVREASVRTLGMRHFDVQLIGGIVLHQGKIAEMKTGEGKTLAATLPVYLNAITGKGVHVVTVNDYLAARDAEWMGTIYKFLGMSVGVIVHGLDDVQRKAAYDADITYGTNNEFGFDYLRDNMKFYSDTLVQRELHYAIVDEVDSILIDEARTPLIISGPAEKSTNLYYQADAIIPALKEEEDYTIDEKARSVTLTDQGVAKAEKALGVENLYAPENADILHHVNQALRAHKLFKRDVDYIVTEKKEVVIVDEFTGRLMPGRRFSDGLHQALEAKEKVKIENENQTLATVTFQNYFRMYEKLAGMTGTADTEAEEFNKIYDLDVVVIPTNKPMIRKDYPDVIYKTKKEKYEAVLNEIEELHAKGQPVLVGTVSIDVSEFLSKRLKKRGIPHAVLNAKRHRQEAEIVAKAGQKGAVTISTNMAGRGTDIVLGEGVCELGGLHILGTERHESRRIDNQLRGRSGRQGDPGSSRFYLSLEDDLLRIFGGERMRKIMETLGMKDGDPIEHSMISRAIENAQKKVEAHNFEIRKQLLEYDDVMNEQRMVIYSQRRRALRKEDLRDYILDMIHDRAEAIANLYTGGNTHYEEWDIKGLKEAVFKQFNIHLELDDDTKEGLNTEGLANLIYEAAVDAYENKEKAIGAADLRELERIFLLQTVDSLWKDHLLSMDHLKEGIGLRGYAQQDPLIVYKREAFEMFQDMIERIKEETLSILFRIQLQTHETMESLMEPKEQQFTLSHGSDDEARKEPVRRKNEKIGRNDPCPCGSGKKYKKCCGA
ncbi:MAG: preprotein translocase subunit SecA [Desulfococcus sp. 4484_241]|nr:MAG: preprotein translocase subunit SecA [Desulfococcus sp. 4484_241]RLC31783.1 MAG: preprotein translocase subunit SecA [Deltaproteobacteria bacterium]